MIIMDLDGVHPPLHTERLEEESESFSPIGELAGLQADSLAATEIVVGVRREGDDVLAMPLQCVWPESKSDSTGERRWSLFR